MKKETKTAYGLNLVTSVVDNTFFTTVRNKGKLIYKRVVATNNPTNEELSVEHQAALNEFYTEYKTASLDTLRVNTVKTS